MGSAQQFNQAQAGYLGAKTEVLGHQGPLTLAWLVIVEGPHRGHIFRLHPDATVIGRDPGCDFVVDDSAVSRQHAKIRVVEGENDRSCFVLHDLATENGTRVDDQEIAKHELEDGDYIQLGRTELVFKQVLPKNKDTDGT
jgi:pSer/pThr/pTyr-binding forkhead associated (FHA) protein